MTMYDIPTFWLLILLKYGYILFILVIIGFLSSIMFVCFHDASAPSSYKSDDYCKKMSRRAKLMALICILSFGTALLMPSYNEALHIIANKYCGTENVPLVVEQVNILKYGASIQPEYIEGEY